MAFPRLWNPSMGGLVLDQPTRLRMPVPGLGSPYTSGQALQRSIAPGGPPQGRTPRGPIPPPAPEPQFPRGGGGDVRFPGQGVVPQPPAPVQPKLEASPFMTTMYKSIQNIDPEQRSQYLSSILSSIKGRMDRYEFRIARGIPLTPEQQRRYDSIKSAFNDIQKYINNPTPYDEFFSRPQVAGTQQGLGRRGFTVGTGGSGMHL